MTSLIRQRLPAVAGILYSSAGFVLLMGIITAETKYPVFRHYTTRQEISDLGGTRPPHGLVPQASAMIFDTTMLIAGVLLLAGAFALWRLYQNRVLTVVSALFGAGALLVGIFPGQHDPASVRRHDRLRVLCADGDRGLQGDLGTVPVHVPVVLPAGTAWRTDPADAAALRASYERTVTVAGRRPQIQPIPARLP